MSAPPWDWTGKHDATLRTLWRKGYAVATIAERIGCTVNQVEGRRTALDLPSRGRGSPRAIHCNEPSENYWVQFRAADRAFAEAMAATTGEGFGPQPPPVEDFTTVGEAAAKVVARIKSKQPKPVAAE